MKEKLSTLCLKGLDSSNLKTNTIPSKALANFQTGNCMAPQLFGTRQISEWICTRTERGKDTGKGTRSPILIPRYGQSPMKECMIRRCTDRDALCLPRETFSRGNFTWDSWRKVPWLSPMGRKLQRRMILRETRQTTFGQSNRYLDHLNEISLLFYLIS